MSRRLMRNPITNLLLIAGFLFVVGCAGHMTPKTPQLSGLLVYNAGAGELRNVRQQYDGHSTAEFAIYPGEAGVVSSVDPIPQSVILTWQREDGTSKEQQLAIAGEVPNNFLGYIFLRIEDDGTVRMVPITYKAFAKGARP